MPIRCLRPENHAPASLTSRAKRSAASLLAARQDVSVDRHRDNRAGVAKALRHDVNRDAGQQSQRRVRMPQIVQPDDWHNILAELLAAPGDVARELTGDVLGVAVLALYVAEDQRIRPGQLQRQGAALTLVLRHHGESLGIEVDYPRPAGLRVTLDDLGAFAGHSHHPRRPALPARRQPSWRRTARSGGGYSNPSVTTSTPRRPGTGSPPETRMGFSHSDSRMAVTAGSSQTAANCAGLSPA